MSGSVWTGSYRKEKKISSSSMDNESFMSLSNDEKLVCLFDTLNRNNDKLISIKQIQRQCMNDNNSMNSGVAKGNNELTL